MSFESDPGHGHSTAAWTAVTIMLLAFTIGTMAFFLDLAWLVWASAALLLVGALAGWMMAKLGYGVDSTKSPHESH